MDKQATDHWETQLKNARKLVGRILIEGDLVLETPTRFGNGDREGVVDMTISRDPQDGRPLLPGASIAGALRSYLRTREAGFRKQEHSASLGKLLFGEETGTTAQNKSSSQSYLIAHDSLAAAVSTELRDGVTIDPKTRTARDGGKYDLELLPAGTVFPLRLELLIVKEKENELKQALAIALQGFEQGEIPMGARRRRGFGKCKVATWRVNTYNLTDPTELIAWLQEETVDGKPVTKSGPTIATLLGDAETDIDKRSIFSVEAHFGIAGSLLIRSGSEDPTAPDMVHLRSKRNGSDQPIVSGTSLAGALRGRALRIARTLSKNSERADCFIGDLFGPFPDQNQNDPGKASRLWVEESVIENPHELVVSRVKIDRFTGGSFPTALFNQQPVFGTDETAVCLCLHIDDPSPADKGLLLLLLKDLWTEDLPVGGEASVGRGRLRGKCATLLSKDGNITTADANDAKEVIWQIRQAGKDSEELEIQGDRTEMEACVQAFGRKMGGAA